MTKKKAAKVYREAARIIAEEEKDNPIWTEFGDDEMPSCVAISVALQREGLLDQFDYEHFLKSIYAITFGFGTEIAPISNQLRVLLLCLMAAMVEAGDIKVKE